jgi:hypothetical protein
MAPSLVALTTTTLALQMPQASAVHHITVISVTVIHRNTSPLERVAEGRMKFHESMRTCELTLEQCLEMNSKLA